MESYVTRDLIAAVEAAFPLAPRRVDLRPFHGRSRRADAGDEASAHFQSVSAFAPISSPTRCPWGEKAFTAYLGADRDAWRAHDAALLMEAGKAEPFDDILVDQGTGDQFLEKQLKPELLEEAAARVGQKLTLRRHEATITRTSSLRPLSPTMSPFTPRAWLNRQQIARRWAAVPARSQVAARTARRVAKAPNSAHTAGIGHIVVRDAGCLRRRHVAAMRKSSATMMVSATKQIDDAEDRRRRACSAARPSALCSDAPAPRRSRRRRPSNERHARQRARRSA